MAILGLVLHPSHSSTHTYLVSFVRDLVSLTEMLVGETFSQ